MILNSIGYQWKNYLNIIKMEKLLFKIRNLSCKYNSGNRIVLEIPELDIPAGKIVFIVGVSGVGKSTILETLGLMNNTIHNDENTEFIFYNPYNSSKETNLYNLWKEKDKIISDFRRKHYSFLFQNTNLMNNLTAYENVYITQLIQGVGKEIAKKKSLKILDSIGLNEIDLNDESPVFELSGGQKQRLAFARAISPSFSVLFGDEPTGNLDHNNAENLFEILKLHITEGKSAIIVSHDIDLAVKYADQIIYINKMEREVLIKGKIEKQYYGKIMPERIYYNKITKWVNHSKEYSNDSLKKDLIAMLYQI